jgi:hypothetical protein
MAHHAPPWRLNPPRSNIDRGTAGDYYYYAAFLGRAPESKARARAAASSSAPLPPPPPPPPRGRRGGGGAGLIG